MAATEADFRTRLQDWLPKLVLAPSFAVTLLFVYGFILFTVVLSLHRLEDAAALRLGRLRQL
jgi:ABC-type sugar transport system permease subunit